VSALLGAALLTVGAAQDPAIGATDAESAAPSTDAAPAEDRPAEPTDSHAAHLSLEIDPLDYTLYKGWGGFVGFHHEALSHWRFRLGGGAASLPSFVVDMVDSNKGWGVRLDPVFTVVAHYFPFEGRGGFFFGPNVGGTSMRFDAPDGGGEVRKNMVFFGGDVGYRWYPFEKLGLVITPHLSVLANLYGDIHVGAQTYHALPVVTQPQVLVGWDFGL
jgi:hypothetical protein